MAIKIAVIGAGTMGADHARIVSRNLKGATLQVVCDTEVSRARAVAEATGTHEISADPQATIARPDVDAVLIASPDETHAPLTLAALQLGKPVLCEKPLATSAATCRQVVDAEVQAGRQLVTVGFMRRFDPPYTAMKDALRQGRLGPALMMHNHHRNVANPSSWFTSEMAISNSAPHEFDIARFVLGAELIAVSAYQPGRSDDAAPPVVMVLETEHRHLVTIEVNNNAAYGYDVRGELVCEQGSVSLNAAPPLRIDSELASAEPYPADWRLRFAEAYRLQDQAWVEAISSGRPSTVAATAWDGFRAAQIAEAAVTSLKERRRVDIEQAQKQRLYSAHD